MKLLPLPGGRRAVAGRELPPWKLLPPAKGSSFTPAVAHLPSQEGSNSLPAIVHLPPREGSNSPVAGSPSQAIAILPPGEGSNSTTALPPPREGDSSPQTGQSNNQNRSGRQGLRHSNRHRATQASQETSTISQEDNTTTTPPSRPPKDLPMKIPTLSGSLNLSSKPLTPAQRSVLAKGPNYAVTPRQPPNLEYITAIEAACTKPSQQDAEELSANINRVLRSSHPPNLI